MVSYLSVSFMAVSAVVCFGLPVALFLAWRKKYELKIVPALIGAAAFMVFAMGLEQLLHLFVLRPGADGSIALKQDNPALFALYGIFAAGIFEETARFISFHLIKKKYSGIGTGLAYGIGHGGIEAMLIAGLTMISSFIISVLVNTGNAGQLGGGGAFSSQIDAIVSADPIMFLVSGFERIVALSIQISLSMFVLCSVYMKGKIWLFPVAIVLHAAVDLAAVFYQIGIIENVFLVEGLILIPAVIFAIAAFYICRMMEKKEETPDAGLIDQPGDQPG